MSQNSWTRAIDQRFPHSAVRNSLTHESDEIERSGCTMIEVQMSDLEFTLEFGP
jgi:hypothetical protein